MTSACHYEQNLPAAPGSGCKEYLQATVPNFPQTSWKLGDAMLQHISSAQIFLSPNVAMLVSTALLSVS